MISTIQKAIATYQKTNNLAVNKSDDIQNINIQEKKFFDELKSVEESYKTGVVNQTNFNNSTISKLTSNTISNLASVLNKTEDLSIKTLNKSVSVAETVATTMHAENIIKTIVTVRDKLLSSYQEILRMNI